MAHQVFGFAVLSLTPTSNLYFRSKSQAAAPEGTAAWLPLMHIRIIGKWIRP
ncbi:hypothetical protein D3C76_1878730 [compost metagenome]|uniref:hypothetical protein n=1 Tax=Paenibacillus TaxID=44249 RepID=UPI000FB8D3CB|nr:hypothetical protein [Paenibacillus vini]MDN4071392.1 hypothetical protein [Paenibacillus vini]